MKERRVWGRRARRGVTLVEVLIVVAIITLISAGVALTAFSHVESTKLKNAKTNARSLRLAVKTWWLENDTTDCPTLSELVKAEALDRDSSRTDPWGEPWHIECTERDVTVISAGKDRKLGTEDDIRIPPT